jgi:hypothetical protein
MAARRLLIVMLVLLGVSTLAAALVPQRTLNEAGTTGTTTTQPTTPTAPVPSPAFLRPTKITVGGKKFPVVSPIKVGDQLSLLVRSRFPAEIEIPEFGLVGFASPNAPARFELLPDSPGTFGILFAASGKPAGQIEVVAPSGSESGNGNEKRTGVKPNGKSSSSRAPAGSNSA